MRRYRSHELAGPQCITSCHRSRFLSTLTHSRHVRPVGLTNSVCPTRSRASSSTGTVNSSFNKMYFRIICTDHTTETAKFSQQDLRYQSSIYPISFRIDEPVLIASHGTRSRRRQYHISSAPIRLRSDYFTIRVFSPYKNIKKTSDFY